MKDTSIWVDLKKSPLKKGETQQYSGTFTKVNSEIKKGNKLKGVSFGTGTIGFIFGDEPEKSLEELIAIPEDKRVMSITSDDLKSNEGIGDTITIQEQPHIIKPVPVHESAYYATERMAKVTGKSIQEISAVLYTAGATAATTYATGNTENAKLAQRSIERLFEELGIKKEMLTDGKSSVMDEFAEFLKGRKNVKGTFIQEKDLPPEVKSLVEKLRKQGADITVEATLVENVEDAETKTIQIKQETEMPEKDGILKKLKGLLKKDE